MSRIVFITLLLLVITMTTCFADSLAVMDTYDLLTPDEVKSGVLFDPDTLFAYKPLDDETIMIVRYTWIAPKVTVPAMIEDLPVVWIGAHAFTDTPVEKVTLPWSVGLDADAFSYSSVKTVRIVGNEDD